MMTDEQMKLISSIGEMVKSDAGTSVETHNDSVRMFGYRQEGYEEDTDVLEDIACGHLEYIIDAIPETDEVQDVTIKTIKNDCNIKNF